jgi:hypothetical protein
MQPINQAGNFRAQPIEVGLREEKSGAVGMSIKVHILERWNPEEGTWEDWRDFQVEAHGIAWLVKKDNGGINENGFKSACQYLGWDGNFESIPSGEFKPTPCQVQVDAEVYKEQTRFRISFLNDYNSTPGQLANVDSAKAKALASRFGAAARALVGNVKRNGPAPTPAAKPPVPPTAPVAPPVAPPHDPNSGEEKIPFA